MSAVKQWVPGRGLAMQRGVTHTHEALMHFMLVNPGATLAEISAYFGYSIAYISMLKNSDAFRAKFEGMRNGLTVQVLGALPEKLAVLGDMVTEKLTEQVAKSDDPRFIKESFDSVLHKLGYAPNKSNAAAPVNQVQNNVYVLNHEDLKKAKEVMQGRVLEANATLDGRAEQIPLLEQQRPETVLPGGTGIKEVDAINLEAQ